MKLFMVKSGQRLRYGGSVRVRWLSMWCGAITVAFVTVEGVARPVSRLIILHQSLAEAIWMKDWYLRGGAFSIASCERKCQ